MKNAILAFLFIIGGCFMTSVSAHAQDHESSEVVQHTTTIDHSYDVAMEVSTSPEVTYFNQMQVETSYLSIPAMSHYAINSKELLWVDLPRRIVSNPIPIKYGNNLNRSFAVLRGTPMFGNVRS